jgi:hypothetical protein
MLTRSFLGRKQVEGLELLSRHHQPDQDHRVRPVPSSRYDLSDVRLTNQKISSEFVCVSVDLQERILIGASVTITEHLLACVYESASASCTYSVS